MSAVDTEDIAISASLNQMMVQPNYYKLINRGFETGDKYIEVKITKATNQNDAEQFMLAFSKLLKLYDDKQQSVIDHYSKYIPDFESKYKVLQKKQLGKPPIKQLLKHIAPKIFKGTHYARSCSNKQHKYYK